MYNDRILSNQGRQQSLGEEHTHKNIIYISLCGERQGNDICFLILTSQQPTKAGISGHI